MELRGRGVSRECRRPAQASVQAAVCRASQRAHRVERRESPSKGRAASPGQCPQFHRDNDNDNDKDKKTITKKTKTKTLILRSGEPKQGPGSFARSVSTVSTAHNAYNTFLDPLTWPLGASKEPLL